ncbi:Nitrogen assimilation transcription factor nirA [Paramyrothecium foliicola]|nr:Nitrogen assimilation transcription factor nirA [Paramyrothecium foliicola]
MSGASSGLPSGESALASTPKAERNPPSAPGKTGARSKYAAKACQECRRRRSKCDGVKPMCSRCTSRQLSCVYTTEDDGRGSAPKSYVRLLQARISVLENILWLHSIDVDASAAQLMQQGAVPAATSPSSDKSPTTAFNELCKAFEGVLSLDESQNFDQDGEPRYFGPASGRLEFRPCNNMSHGSPLLRPSLPIHKPAVALTGAPAIDDELESHLLQLYFTWEQPWLQAVDEALFRDSMKSGGRYFSPLLLNCLCASGSRFSDRIEVRSDPDDSNTAGYRYLDAAALLLQLELKSPAITTIQSLIVLGTVCHAFGQDAAGWQHSGMAHRLILEMGFNQDPASLVTSGQMTIEEAELRRQIYWSLYTVDKLAAVYTGRVCSMLDHQAEHSSELQITDKADVTGSTESVFDMHTASIDNEIGQSPWMPMRDTVTGPPDIPTAESFSFEPDIDSLWELFDWTRPDSTNWETLSPTEAET